ESHAILFFLRSAVELRSFVVFAAAGLCTLHHGEFHMRSCRSLVLLAAFGATPMPLASREQQAAPEVPKEIAVPPGHKLLFQLEAKGVQIYKAAKGSSGMLEWVLEAPLADLFDAKGAKAGSHYEGPSWEAVDGSKVVRDKAADVKSAPAPKPK